MTKRKPKRDGARLNVTFEKWSDLEHAIITLEGAIQAVKCIKHSGGVSDADVYANAEAWVFLEIEKAMKVVYDRFEQTGRARA